MRVRPGIPEFGVIGGLLVVMMLVVAACDDKTLSTEPTTAGESPAASAPTSIPGGSEGTPSPSRGIGLSGGWVLESLDGHPPIEGPFATLLELDRDRFDGFDGCNSYSGRSEDGVPIADADGRFLIQYIGGTDRDCPEPEGITDQADAYISALVQGERFRIVDDRLEILDDGGVTRLVFVKQARLPGHPVDLEGTGWRLLTEGDAMDGVHAPTLAFLDHRLVTGDGISSIIS